MGYIFDEARLVTNFNAMNAFNTINMVWKGTDKIKGLCKASKTGHGSTLFDKLQPVSYLDFFTKSQTYAIENKDKMSIYERGLTIEELTALANEFANKVHILDSKITFDIQNYIDYIIYVNIIQTFDGHINEVQLVEYINKYWYTDAHRVTGILDSQYGIDILYRNNTRGIQVKSIKFFLGKKSSVINDRKNIKPLKDKVLKKFGIDMKYAIYDRDKKQYLISSNGTPVFSFQEFHNLLQYDDTQHPVLSYPTMAL